MDILSSVGALSARPPSSFMFKVVRCWFALSAVICFVIRSAGFFGPEHIAVLNPAAGSHLLHPKPLRPQVSDLAYARSLGDAERGRTVAEKFAL